MTEHMVIADVATGTGAWAFDMTDNVAGTVQIEGLDIDLSKTPPRWWLPSNVSFKKFDLLNEVPDELIKRYDIVHVRYIVPLVQDAKFETILGRLSSMLSKAVHLACRTDPCAGICLN